MFAQKNIAGQKFGHWLVLKLGKPIRGKGKEKRKYVGWWVLCQKCGREELRSYQNIVRTTCCSVCMRGACVICGAEIVENTRRNTCSKICHDIKRKNIQNLNYAKKLTNDPNFNKKRWDEKKQRAKSNPEYANKILEWDRIAKKRAALNPDHLAKRKKYQHDHWLKNKNELMKKRMERLQRMSPSHREIWLAARREESARWWRQKRAEIRKNPEQHQQFLLKNRKYQREYYRQKSLAQFLKLTDQLTRGK